MSYRENGAVPYRKPGQGLVNTVAERPPILDMDQFQYQQAIKAVLHGVFAAERHGAKRLAQAAGVTVETAKNWLRDEQPVTPQGLHLMRLMATVPELQAEMLRLAAIETSMPAEFEAAFLAATRVYRRIKAAEDE